MLQATGLPPTLELIGNTPLVRLTGFDCGLCEVFLKLESQNPGGSIKDRIGVSMVAGRRRGWPAAAWRHDGGGDGRQHGCWAGAGGGDQRLPADSGDSRQDVAREDRACQGAGRRHSLNAVGCGARASALLQRHGGAHYCRDTGRFSRGPVR